MLFFTHSRRGKVASFPLVLSPSLHAQPFLLLHLPLCYLVGPRLVVGFGSDPPNLLPIKGPFARNCNRPPPERQHSCRTQDPISCVSAHLPLGCVWRAAKRQGIGKQLIISRVPVYQRSPPLNSSCLLAAWDHWALGWTTFLVMQT